MERFNEFQLGIYTAIQQIQDEIENLMDVSTFVLNDKLQDAYNKLEQLQSKCDHIWENDTCIVCGAVKQKE